MTQLLQDKSETTMLVKVPVQVTGLSVAYSFSLGWLERKFPNIKPDHTWAEVAGGVLLSLIPVGLEARRRTRYEPDNPLYWQTYEAAVWRAFIASGTPIILWQLGEAVFRHMELMHYTTQHERRSLEIDAYDTTALAGGSREREGTDSGDLDDRDQVSSGSTEEN